LNFEVEAFQATVWVSDIEAKPQALGEYEFWRKHFLCREFV